MNEVLRVKNAILDGEVITKDATGRPIFLALSKRPEEPSYIAFDLLWLKGRVPLTYHGVKLSDKVFQVRNRVNGPAVRDTNPARFQNFEM